MASRAHPTSKGLAPKPKHKRQARAQEAVRKAVAKVNTPKKTKKKK